MQDLCCYLGALANPRDEDALLGLLASPLVGASSDALALLGMAARARARARCGTRSTTRPLDVPARDREPLAAFRAWFAAERERAPRLGLDELLRAVVRRTGYDLHVLALPGGARRLANIHKLLRLAAGLRGRAAGATSAASSTSPPPSSRPTRASPTRRSTSADLDAVRLMTIHAAKGLEFRVVVVADLGRRGTNRQPDLLVDGDRVGLRLVGMDGSSEKALALRRDRDASGARPPRREERRVMHVALTRAEERLILSGAVRPRRRAGPRPGPGAAPMSWIGPALVPGLARARARRCRSSTMRARTRRAHRARAACA